MKVAEARKWARDLRSGKYKQCFGTFQNEYGKVCALGVLAQLDPDSYYHGPNIQNAIYKAKEVNWFTCENYEFNFTQLNDSYELNFNEIADIVEAVYILKVLD